MLHSDWFSLTALVFVNVSFSDMMQGDNGNIKVLLGIASFTDYLAIYMIYHCIVVFCLYSKMALYNSKLQKYYERDRSYSRDRSQKYYERNKSYRGDRSPQYYKNDYEREYYNTFLDQGNKRNYKIVIKTSIGIKISMIVIDPMIQIILMVEIGHMTETGHIVETGYIVETGTTPKNTKETGHMLEIDYMTEMIHIVEIDHETTVEMSIMLCNFLCGVPAFCFYIPLWYFLTFTVPCS